MRFPSRHALWLMLIAHRLLAMLFAMALASYGAEPIKAEPNEQVWGAEAEGFQLSARVDGQAFEPCTAIVLTISIRNATSFGAQFRQFRCLTPISHCLSSG